MKDKELKRILEDLARNDIHQLKEIRRVEKRLDGLWNTILNLKIWDFNPFKYFQCFCLFLLMCITWLILKSVDIHWIIRIIPIIFAIIFMIGQIYYGSKVT